MPPVVSIVIPAFNNAAHIEETMRSVLAQDHRDLEVIVADHSSADDTWERLQQFGSDPRVTLLTTEAGGGAARNWNRVTEAAHGEFLKLVCGDDVIYPTMVSEQVAAFEEGVVMVASARDIVDARGRPVITERGLAGLSGRVPGKAALRRTVRAGTNVFGEPACVMLRTRSFTEVGLWDGRYSYLIDEASYSRVLLTGDLVAIPRSLAAFRVSGGQWSVRLASSQASETIAFHDDLTKSAPGLLGPMDLVLGAARARVAAIGRRVVYLLLGSRMRSAR